MIFTPLTLPSPAKINLCLHITGKRADGYHNLQTLFQILDFGDQLTIQANDSGQITIEPELPDVPLQSNLIYKAALLLRDKAFSDQRLVEDKPGASILIDKQLPMGGGLGGGSSNAATCLLGLNHLWQLNYDLETLANLGLSLGADVPVFIKGQTAWGEGVGEKLQAVELEDKWYVVLTPACSISTAEIFSHNCLTRDTPIITVAAFLEQGGHNDCQPVVESLYPEVKEAIDWLSGFSPAQLTGTGASLFASFSSEKEAYKVLGMAPETLRGFVAKSANQSPLHRALLFK